MTLLFVYTVLMAVFNIVSGVFTYKIFKQLSLGVNMSTIEKESKTSFGDVLPLFPKAQPDEKITFQYVPDKAFVGNDGNSNIPIITNDEEMPEDEGSMLSRLKYLSDFLNDKYNTSKHVTPESWEDMKWEAINETYCLITVDLPRRKSEIVRKYFRRLNTTYVKHDGTYYSKVTKGDVAKDIIDELIEVYPWDELHEHKEVSNANEIKINPGVHFSPDKGGFLPAGYVDNLKDAIGSLSKSVDKLNEILSSK